MLILKSYNESGFVIEKDLLEDIVFTSYEKMLEFVKKYLQDLEIQNIDEKLKELKENGTVEIDKYYDLEIAEVVID